MPLAATYRPRAVEFSIVHGAKPAGPSIGKFAGRDIPEAVEDDFGHLLTYAGVAPRLYNGKYDVDALKPGEFIVQPGLIYRRIN